MHLFFTIIYPCVGAIAIKTYHTLWILLQLYLWSESASTVSNEKHSGKCIASHKVCMEPATVKELHKASDSFQMGHSYYPWIYLSEKYPSSYNSLDVLTWLVAWPTTFCRSKKFWVENEVTTKSEQKCYIYSSNQEPMSCQRRWRSMQLRLPARCHHNPT